MATLQGAIRSYRAVARRIEREEQRRAREAARRFKEQQKLQEIADARQAVKDWTSYIRMIQSVHRNCTDSINWGDIKKEPKPEQPVKSIQNETLARQKLEKFRPNIFDKLFGLTKKKIGDLEIQLSQPKEKDNKEFQLAMEEYNQELKNWNELQGIAKGIANKDLESYQKALEYFNPFDDIGELGTQIKFSFNENYIDVELHVNSEEIIPDFELSQTSTGKLSKKNMAKSKFNELYQDHICSSIIRVAREVFAYLPIDYARINAMTKLLNTKTGHFETKPILSVIIPPETIKALNLETIDPSDSMQNFVHNMNFKKNTGFGEVEKVEFDK